MRLTGSLQGRPEVAAIEVHLSGPDLELERDVLGAHADRAAEIGGAVARMSLVPVFAKIPTARDRPRRDRARRGPGRASRGWSSADRRPPCRCRPTRLRPDLGGVTGWLSGPAVAPLMLRSVFEVARADARDSRRRRSGASGPVMTRSGRCSAGAWAVQVGSATLIDPSAPVTVAQGIVRYLKDKGMGSPGDVRAQASCPRVVRCRRGPQEQGTDAMIPRPDQPVGGGARRERPGCSRTARGVAGAAREHAEGRPRVDWAAGPDAVRRIAEHGAGVRRREAARHPHHGGASRREHRAAGGRDAQRSRAGRRRHDARGARRCRARRRGGGSSDPVRHRRDRAVVAVGRGARFARFARRSRRGPPGWTASWSRAVMSSGT